MIQCFTGHLLVWSGASHGNLIQVIQQNYGRFVPSCFVKCCLNTWSHRLRLFAYSKLLLSALKCWQYWSWNILTRLTITVHKYTVSTKLENFLRIISVRLGPMKFYKFWTTYSWVHSGHNCSCTVKWSLGNTFTWDVIMTSCRTKTKRQLDEWRSCTIRLLHCRIPACVS